MDWSLINNVIALVNPVHQTDWRLTRQTLLSNRDLSQYDRTTSPNKDQLIFFFDDIHKIAVHRQSTILPYIPAIENVRHAIFVTQPLLPTVMVEIDQIFSSFLKIGQFFTSFLQRDRDPFLGRFNFSHFGGIIVPITRGQAEEAM